MTIGAARAPERLRGADLVGVGAAKLAASLGVLTCGFRAVSDDDYARVVIAQRFAETPHLDPSGTSWLPLPFWVYGGALRLFGENLAIARGVAIFLGVLAALLLLWAARLLGAGRSGAVLGALIASLFPWSVWLGAATVPELPTAALMLFGVATLALDAPRERLLGACALAAACFSRYEAWPVAAVFAASTLFDAARRRDIRSALPGVVALGPVALWLLHGIFIHGDALFFWKRVAAYRNALGAAPPLAERLLAVPRWLFATEPELSLAAIVAGFELRGVTSYRRPLIACGALVVFLTAGELAGGGPTHHAERAVLTVWLFAALALGDALGRASERRHAPRIAWVGSAAIVALGWLYRARVPPAFPDRRAAVAVGTAARELGAPALLIDTSDYSYLAVTAAFGNPNAAPFDDHDPRHARSANAFASEATLRARLVSQPRAWLVVQREHEAVARRVATPRAETSGLALLSPRE